MTRKKVLTIITKLELGGAQQVALNTVKRLPKEKYHKYLISGQKGLLVKTAMQLKDVHVELWKSLKHPIRPFADLITLIRLVSFIKKNQIDIVHTHSSKAGILGRLAAWLAGCPKIVHTIHGWPFHEHQSVIARSCYILLEQIGAGMTNHLIAVSEATKQKGLKHKIGKDSQYQVIYPGSDLKAFGPGIVDDNKWLNETFGIKEFPPVVGMIACLKEQKAPLDFVRAAALVIEQMKDVKFLLVGDGQLRKKVEDEIMQAGLQHSVILTGWRDDISQVMKGLSLLVLTSLWEGLPCVFGQAMKTGLPIIATDVEGAKEAIINNENGLIVPKQEPEAMAQAIMSVLKDKNFRIRLGKTGLKQADIFSIEETVKKITELYQ